MTDMPRGDNVLAYAAKGKRVIAGVLLALMFLVVAIGTIELVLVVGREIIASASLSTQAENFLLSEAGLFKIFGLFLNVLIAVELIETVEVYFREHSLHAETVVLVAIIAVARKAILLDLSTYSAGSIAALAGLIVALGVVYYLVKHGSLRPARDLT